MKHYDYLIVGSGLYGAVFTRQALDAGKSCLVLEKRAHTGGNIRCERIEGIDVHVYGAHIFHTTDREVWEYIDRFTPCNRYTNSPIANYKGELYNLPFNMNTFHQMWGVRTPDEARRMIEKQRAVIKGEPKNLEEQAISLVGTDIYEKLVKGYTEKQWGRDCRELPAFIIKRLPVRFTYDNNYFNDPYQGIPIEGYNALTDRLLDGADVILNTDYNSDRETWNAVADRVLYTGTLDSFYDYRFGKLEYRSLRFETETREDTDNFQGVAVVNYTDVSLPFTRIIEHKHFAWTEGMEPYYPFNDDRNGALYAKYAALAAKENRVLFGGRLAEYKYYDMDKVVRAALDAAKREFGGRV